MTVAVLFQQLINGKTKPSQDLKITAAISRERIEYYKVDAHWPPYLTQEKNLLWASESSTTFNYTES